MTAQHLPPTRAARITPLEGNEKRAAAGLQGHLWVADGAVDNIAHHVETGETIDRRGDVLLKGLRLLLRRARRSAREEGATETAAMLDEAIGRADLVAELDDAEDWHRRRTGTEATDADRALDAANAVCGLLLGQREGDLSEVMPLTLVAPIQDDDPARALAFELGRHMQGCPPCAFEQTPGCDEGDRLVAMLHAAVGAPDEDRRGGG